MDVLLQAYGGRIYPLRDASDVADLLEAAARVPAWTPDRAKRMVDYLSTNMRSIVGVGISFFQVDSVLSHATRLGTAERFEEVAASIPPGNGQVIVTHRNTCVVCSKGVLEVQTNAHGKEYGASPQLFTQDGPVQSCRLLWKACSHCKAKHYYSYAVGGDLVMLMSRARTLVFRCLALLST